LLPKETLVLIDGKRVALTGTGGLLSGVAGVDINLIPLPMIDHIDILKDGASAVYGSDAVAGVINIFLLHKFRGLEIGGSAGNTNMGASNDARELEGWIKAGTGDDKTDILVIADFYDRAAIYSRDRNIESNAFGIPWGTIDFRVGSVPGAIAGSNPFRLIPRLFFSPNSPPPHSAANVATSPFYVNPLVIAPTHIQARRVSSVLMHANIVHNTWASMGTRAVAITSSITTSLRRRTFQRRIAKATMALLRVTFATST
jgi:outer membrane receptor protein involved in Fe transport